MMSAFKTTVFSNFWIAFCAMASTLLTFYLQNQQVTIAPLGLLFFITLARYNIIAFTLPAKVTGEKFLFMQTHRKLLKVLCVFSLLVGVSFTYWLSIKQIVFLAHLGLLTLWYIFPLHLGFIKLKPLRKLPFLKIFLIAYVWSSSSFIMPLLANNITINVHLGLAFLERLLFLFSITIPFDIKDYEDDKRLALKTIPNTFGITRSKYVAILCLVVCLFIVIYIYPIHLAIAMSISYLITAPFIWKATLNKPAIYFLGWVDGTMIWQLLLVYFAIEGLPYITK